jgi:hypothetical protein
MSVTVGAENTGFPFGIAIFTLFRIFVNWKILAALA